MLTQANLSRPLTFVLCAVALAAAACQTTVVGGGSGGGGGGGGTGGIGGSVGDGGAVSTGGSGGAVATTAIAEYGSMISPPDPSGTTSSGSSSGGGTGVDPNTLYVRIGNYGPACFDGGTTPFSCTPVTSWGVSLGLPINKQSPGVYALDAADIISTFSESGGSGAGDCWGGGGSFTLGTVEVLSNDGYTINVRLQGTNFGVTDVSTDGDYSASICQWGLD